MKPYICGEISTVTFDPGLQTCACHVSRIVFSNSGYWNCKQIPIQLLGEVTFGGTREMDEMEMPMILSKDGGFRIRGIYPLIQDFCEQYLWFTWEIRDIYIYIYTYIYISSSITSSYSCRLAKVWKSLGIYFFSGLFVPEVFSMRDFEWRVVSHHERIRCDDRIGSEMGCNGSFWIPPFSQIGHDSITVPGLLIISCQIIATSHDRFPPKCSWGREILEHFREI